MPFVKKSTELTFSCIKEVTEEFIEWMKASVKEIFIVLPSSTNNINIQNQQITKFYLLFTCFNFQHDSACKERNNGGPTGFIEAHINNFLQ